MRLSGSILKYQKLGNFCSIDMEEPRSIVTETMNRLKGDPERVEKAIRGSKLPLPA
ncbi:MAG: hypothetical protein M1393_09050 [Candidatus Thermoplasmatota archaeon]|jgi:hypothetical protein|nr:hypothetical protein [Candidatus Thermoplasmatota archaeon]